MNLRRIVPVFLFVFLISLTGTALAGSAGNNKETLAKALYAIAHGSGFGDNKYIFNKVEIIEVGKDLGRGAPIKFRLSGIYGYKTQTKQPKDFNGFAWVGDTIEAEEPFSDTFVVFYSKNEFGKTVACTEVHFPCIDEENITNYRTMLENMKIQHKRAKAQDLQQQATFARRQREANIRQVRIEQLRRQAQMPTKILGKYRFFDRWPRLNEHLVPLGEVILTDVDASYVFVDPHVSGEPDRVKVVLEFSNIMWIRKGGNDNVFEVWFDLGHQVYKGPGWEGGNISFANAITRDRFYNDIVEAKRIWDQKYPELKLN
jgi:hypothetical protein